MNIRQAAPSDLDSLESIERRCFDKERFPREFLSSLLEEEEFITILAVEDGKVVGAASMLLMEDDRTARLISLAVVPDHRCRGVGRQLLEALQKDASSLGARRMSLEVNVLNVPGVNLYLHNGFRIIGVYKDYYGRGRDAYCMERRIG